MNIISMQITQTEFQARNSRLVNHLIENELTGVIIFDNYYILYYTGFSFVPTERPIAYLMNALGDRVLFVPRLEKEHAQGNSVIDRVEFYTEYPDSQHPTDVLKDLLHQCGIQPPYAADQDGYPRIFGFRGPSLSQSIGASPSIVSDFIEDQMMIKSASELALIQESVKWGHLAHTLLQRYTIPGISETIVSQRASQEATLAMLDSIGPIYRAQSPFSNGAEAAYRGQIGRNAAIPHALANNIVFQPGDVLVTGAGAPVWGYNSELERTMIIKPVTDEHKVFFDHMLGLQDLALASMQPGEPCFVVDRAVRKYFEKHDLMPYWRHHSGHAIGLRYHEGPFLDIGDHTIMQPGMVFTVEPGLYSPTVGGFRHSDTVVISEDGIEILTYYPRDLDSLTLPS